MVPGVCRVIKVIRYCGTRKVSNGRSVPGGPTRRRPYSLYICHLDGLYNNNVSRAVRHRRTVFHSIDKRYEIKRPGVRCPVCIPRVRLIFPPDDRIRLERGFRNALPRCARPPPRRNAPLVLELSIEYPNGTPGIRRNAPIQIDFSFSTLAGKRARNTIFLSIFYTAIPYFFLQIRVENFLFPYKFPYYKFYSFLQNMPISIFN